MRVWQQISTRLFQSPHNRRCVLMYPPYFWKIRLGNCFQGVCAIASVVVSTVIDILLDHSDREYRPFFVSIKSWNVDYFTGQSCTQLAVLVICNKRNDRYRSSGSKIENWSSLNVRKKRLQRRTEQKSVGRETSRRTSLTSLGTDIRMTWGVKTVCFCLFRLLA